MAELSEEQIELWVIMMRDISFEEAQGNLMQHIRSNRFPPTVAEIMQQELSERVDPELHARNRQIAHQQWVAAGGDPEEFTYGQTELPRLRG